MKKDRPRLLELYDCMRCNMSRLCAFEDEGIRVFAELNHVCGLSIEPRQEIPAPDVQDDCEIGYDVGLHLIVKFKSEEEAEKQLNVESLRWLENHFGAILRASAVDSRYVFYRMYAPNGKRYDELYPQLVKNPWRHYEVVLEDK